MAAFLSQVAAAANPAIDPDESFDLFLEHLEENKKLNLLIATELGVMARATVFDPKYDTVH